MFFQFLVIKGLDPDRIRIRIGLQPQTLDPDPEKMNTDPKPCIQVRKHLFPCSINTHKIQQSWLVDHAYVSKQGLNKRYQCYWSGSGQIGIILPDPDPHPDSDPYPFKLDVKINYTFSQEISIYCPKCWKWWHPITLKRKIKQCKLALL